MAPNGGSNVDSSASANTPDVEYGQTPGTSNIFAYYKQSLIA